VTARRLLAPDLDTGPRFRLLLIVGALAVALIVAVVAL